ncbi:MAG: Rne/Rng family ribonuclease [Peptococcaceae bacterium]|nr:Rne/Rng family ribonuclease [Peptococcaceae bacterium]
MRREILMKVEGSETKVVVTEDGRLVELYVERERDQRVVGNIYKGIVKNILPGMQAAFVDIGLEKNAFLYVADARTAHGDEAKGIEGLSVPIQGLLKEGQDIMVQISKEPVGTKGARITSQITIPGRFLVLMPTMDNITVSRRITEGEEKRRLLALAQELKPGGMGLIVRTVGEGASREDLIQDRDHLLRIWEGIAQNYEKGGARGLVYQDLALSQRILRDIFSTDVNRLMVNSRQLYNQVVDFIETMEPRLKKKVFVCNMEELFEKYNVDFEMRQALDRKVWMKNGSYLIFDHTEALTVIDVNTGKYVGSTNLDDTVLRTNVEAAREIARQLRIRNIGGIIIIDFIDMNEETHKRKVLEAFEAELKKDKVRTHILGITALGLVEITRKKVRQSLDSTLETCCPVCGGKGRVPYLSEE